MKNASHIFFNPGASTDVLPPGNLTCVSNKFRLNRNLRTNDNNLVNQAKPGIRKTLYHEK